MQELQRILVTHLCRLYMLAKEVFCLPQVFGSGSVSDFRLQAFHSSSTHVKLLAGAAIDGLQGLLADSVPSLQISFVIGFLLFQLFPLSSLSVSPCLSVWAYWKLWKENWNTKVYCFLYLWLSPTYSFAWMQASGHVFLPRALDSTWTYIHRLF